MLLSFSVENWQSFRDKATLSMVASREKQHEDHLFNLENYDLKLLPTAAIYGGNASGKTKFFNALEFVQKFVTLITQPQSIIARKYFKLDKKYAALPSKFELTLFLNNKLYEYSFSITNTEVIEEKLIQLSDTKEIILYHRTNNKITFKDGLEEDNPRLRFIAEGTRNNQLFLTKSSDENMHDFEVIYNWFKHYLILISPESRFGGTINPSSMSDWLSKLDTGIQKIAEKPITIDDLNLKEEFKSKILNTNANEIINIKDSSSGRHINIKKQNGELTANELIPYHLSINDEEIPFEFRDESAGTLRLLDLLPAFDDLLDHNCPRTYFIDELERCLHTNLTRHLLELFLNSRTNSTRGQLLFTTHNAMLLDQNLLRRDELWLTDRNHNGCSSLTSVAEYDIRADKDIRKSYLQGHLGGVPDIKV